MQITQLRIENFRGIKSLELQLDETTVFIGANNTGKTAILEAVRIGLSRRWGRRGTGFTEYDIHRPEEGTDPRTAPQVQVYLEFEEQTKAPWGEDMFGALTNLIVARNGQNIIWLKVSCSWDSKSESYEPAWEFLDASGAPFTQRAQRSTNLLSTFFDYVPIFYLSPLRSVDDEFGPRSSLWSRVLRYIRVPPELEAKVKGTLDGLDAELLKADPRLDILATTIGQAANVSISRGKGDARLRMLPMTMWELVSRAGVILKDEESRPWLPLDHHGQGLQSLSVIFLFKAAISQQLAEEHQPESEPIFLIEEPEVHLHPQAARTLWERLHDFPGQKLVTTHSPSFVQNVPLHNLRLVSRSDDQLSVSRIPKSVVSDLPWNENVEKLSLGSANELFKDGVKGLVAANSWLEPRVADSLVGCFKNGAKQEELRERIKAFRHNCRRLVTAQEEHELSFLGRRVRGEIFFARVWVLVEGQSEYVLLHALGRAFKYPLDQHGVAVVDFQNNGNASIYPALATSLNIRWRMLVDGDPEGERFRGQLLKRGFNEDDLARRFYTLPKPNTLEGQLIADGHDQLLRKILAEVTSDTALSCSADDFAARLANKKIECISRLALRVEKEVSLANSMPNLFRQLISDLKSDAL